MSDDGVRKSDRSIAGSGELPGGQYGKVAIAGSGSVDGDLEADEIEVAGSGNLNGSVKAEKLNSAGSCFITGDVEVGLIKSSGSFEAGGDIISHSVEAAGAHTVGGSLKAEVINIAGSCRVENDVEADQFVVDGSFRVSGLVNAGRVEVKLGGRTRTTREAQAMGRLGSHPHIVTVFDLGGHEGQPYMVTELMGGGDVEAVIEDATDHRLPLEQAIEIAKETCQGLEFAHSRGRPELAWTCCDCADTLLQRNNSGDREKAMSLLDESLVISSEPGMRPLMKRVLSRREILSMTR